MMDFIKVLFLVKKTNIWKKSGVFRMVNTRLVEKQYGKRRANSRERLTHHMQMLRQMDTISFIAFQGG